MTPAEKSELQRAVQEAVDAAVAPIREQVASLLTAIGVPRDHYTREEAAAVLHARTQRLAAEKNLGYYAARHIVLADDAALARACMS